MILMSVGFCVPDMVVVCGGTLLGEGFVGVVFVVIVSVWICVANCAAGSVCSGASGPGSSGSGSSGSGASGSGSLTRSSSSESSWFGGSRGVAPAAMSSMGLGRGVTACREGNGWPVTRSKNCG